MKEFIVKHKKKLIIASIVTVIAIFLIVTTKDYDIKLNNNLDLYDAVVDIRNDDNYTIKYSTYIDNEYVHIADIKIDNTTIHIDCTTISDIYLDQTGLAYNEYKEVNGVYEVELVEIFKYSDMFVLESMDINDIYQSDYDEYSYYSSDKSIKIVMLEHTNIFVFFGDHKFEYITETNNSFELPNIK